MTDSNGIVFVISGPSGSGKGTVVSILKDIYPNVGVSVSATSRLPRNGEIDGEAYFFKTREEFEALIAAGKMLEYNEYNGNYYGTLKSEAERIVGEGKDLILEIDVNGGAQVRKLMGDKCVTIMLIAPDEEELERRLRGRGTDSDEVIRGRLKRAGEEILLAPEYDYITVNGSGDPLDCAEAILSIIRSEHLKSSRVSEYIGKHYFKKK